MLNQSFSLKNFTKIFEIENRKGNFESKFYSDEFHRLSGELKKQRAIIKLYKGGREVPREDDKLKDLYDEKKKLENQKKNELELTLQEYSGTVNSKDFKFSISKTLHKPSGKYIYPLTKDAPSFFAMKQLQYNVNRTFGVKQGNRYLISKQVQSLLKDNISKIVLRTDIKSFYESVSQSRLLEKIFNNQLLSPKSKALIKSLLFSYNQLTGQLGTAEEDRKGIPRGAGISAYLAELYMREVDDKIRRMDDVIYYSRYVDDIVVVFRPNWKLAKADYKTQVQKVIVESGLEMNNSKSFTYDLENDRKEINIEFLGYVFNLKDLQYLNTSMSSRKIDKYVSRIEKSLNAFLEQRTFGYNEASKLLIHRFNYLTKNTRLHRPKKGLVGIYYSNSLIEVDCKDLKFLDSELKRLVGEKLPTSHFPKLNRKLEEYSFENGFKNRYFFNVNSKRKNIADLRPTKLKESRKLVNNFERVISIWK
ncbi:antiviral reverse transcriptase Drt3a [Maribacter sp. 2210JD10-5]|uniref:antiviral reverse transcriptase Drt3a n=1 Tax=Maribacter sp. 2210JD10-5 TaxID=3386272 RepID=UPI0039BCECC0